MHPTSWLTNLALEERMGMKVSKFHSPPVPSSGLLPHRREEDILNPLPWAPPHLAEPS